jgi:hypothetical protein
MNVESNLKYNYTASMKLMLSWFVDINDYEKNYEKTIIFVFLIDLFPLMLLL